MSWRAFIPVGVFIALAVALFVGLGRDPALIFTPMMGHPVPEFSLPPIDNQSNGFSDADLKTGGLSAVNIFASWCAPCRQEHPQLMALAEVEGLSLYGINYKDDPANARSFLDKLGDPYGAVGADRNGRVSIDWGVYGVPETYFVNGAGEIIYKHVGAILPQDLERKIMPMLKEHGL